MTTVVGRALDFKRWVEDIDTTARATIAGRVVTVRKRRVDGRTDFHLLWPGTGVSTRVFEANCATASAAGTRLAALEREWGRYDVAHRD